MLDTDANMASGRARRSAFVVLAMMGPNYGKSAMWCLCTISQITNRKMEWSIEFNHRKSLLYFVYCTFILDFMVNFALVIFISMEKSTPQLIELRGQYFY